MTQRGLASLGRNQNLRRKRNFLPLVAQMGTDMKML